MSEKAEIRQATMEALRDGLDGLHARRGELVQRAKVLRLERDAVWERVVEISEQIVQTSADLAEAVRDRQTARREVDHA